MALKPLPPAQNPLVIDNRAAQQQFYEWLKSVDDALRKGQIPGTATNDDASAGNVGEYLSASNNVAVLPAGAPLSVTSLALTAGDWDVSGGIFFPLGSPTSFVGFAVSLSTVAHTIDTSPDRIVEVPTNTVDVSPAAIAGPARFTVAAGATTTVHLVGYAAYVSGAVGANGKIWARRVR